MAEKNPLVNHRIRATEVRVIDPDGEQLGVISLEEALQKAEEFGLDLVEVAPQATPSVCKIMDYGKYKYQQKKRTSEAKKNSSRVELKELKLRLKTDDHDIATKLKHARKFLDQNNKVKFTVMFKGREARRPEFAEDMLLDIADQLMDVADVEQPPKLEGHNMTMLVGPGGTTPPDEDEQQDQQA